MECEKFTVTDFCGIFSSEDPKGTIIQISGRSSACIIVTLSGRLRFSFGSENFEADKRHAVFIPDGACYKNECFESAAIITFCLFGRHFICQPIVQAPSQRGAYPFQSIPTLDLNSVF